MSIVSDDTTPHEGDDAATSALLASLMPPKSAKAAAAKADDEDLEDEDDDDLEDGEDDEDADGDEDEDADDDGDEDEDEDSEDEGEDADGDSDGKTDELLKAEVADDATVKVTVDGVETEFTVGSLKRLAGQEASLTRKSQEAELVGTRAAAMIQGALEGVAADLKPYEGIDWLSLSTQMEPDEFQWHRENFTHHQARLNDLMGRAEELNTSTTERMAANRKEQAEQAVTELKADVPEWSPQLYSDIMAFAVKQGLDAEDVAQIANAKIIKLLHKAMLHDAGKATVAAKVAKVSQTPKRVKGSSSSERIGNASSGKQARLEKVVRSGRGSEADAVAALMGRWAQ